MDTSKTPNKPLRYFNGRCNTFQGPSHGYIVARSKAEAVRLGQAAFGKSFTATELNKYWAEAWGDEATEALGTPLESGAYIRYRGRFYRFAGKSSTATW